MVSIVGWAVGIQKHPNLPVILIHCQDVKKVPQLSGMRSWIKTLRPVGAPKISVLGASTVPHTSRGSPSIYVLPPDEGVVLADVDSVGGGRFASESQASYRTMADSVGSQMGVLLDFVFPPRAFFLWPLRFGLTGLVFCTRCRCISWIRVLSG